jgi:hypothetical protein
MTVADAGIPVASRWIGVDRRALATFGVVAAIMAGAALIRLLVIGRGDPFVYHPDEWVTVKGAIRMVGDSTIMPPWFYYPSLLVEVTAPIVAAIHAQTGASLMWEPPFGLGAMRQLGWSEALPEQFVYFAAARSIVAVTGVLAVPVVFAAARRVDGMLAGLVAGAVMAGSVLAVVESTSATTDMPMTLGGAVAMWASLRLLDERRMRWLAIAMVAAGLATTTKYTGAAFLLLPAATWLLGRPPEGPDPLPPVRSALVTSALAGLAIVVGTPALILDPQAVITGITLQAEVQAEGLVGNTSSGPRILANLAYYGEYAARSGFGPALTLLILIGGLRAIRRRHAADILLVGFAVLYVLVTSVSQLRFDRYLLPAAPVLAVLAGSGATAVVSVLTGTFTRTRPSWPAGLLAPSIVVLVALVATAPTTASVIAELRRPDTRTEALDWIRDNLHRASIARERYTPQVGEPTHPVDVAVNLIDRPLEFYRSRGYEYLIASDLTYRRYFDGEHPTEQAAYEEIFSLPEIYTIQPGPDQTGPMIRIFRIDGSDSDAS